MQFAVFSKDAIVYVGDNPTEAAEAFRSESGVVMETFSTPEELRDKFAAHTADLKSLSSNEEICVEAFNKILDALDEIGVMEKVENCAATIQEQSEKWVGTAKHLGVQVMKTAGDKFVWLGRLLQEASK